MKGGTGVYGIRGKMGRRMLRIDGKRKKKKSMDGK